MNILSQNITFIVGRINKALGLTRRSMLLFIMLILGMFNISAWAQAPAFPIEIHAQVASPVPPYLPMLEQELSGGQGAIDQRVMGTVRNNGSVPLRIKIYAVLERIAPSPISIGINPNYQVEIPISLNSQQIIQLTQGHIAQAFGNFSENNLIFTGTSMMELRNKGINFKLPEGQYRICLTAYDFNTSGQTSPLSAPGTGCGYFNICYSANAPQLIMPVSSVIQTELFQKYTPVSHQIQFSWTPPISTCGAQLGILSYDMEIKEVFEGQAINDAAKYNPHVFKHENIHNTTFIFDTLLNQNILKNNHKYIVRIKANIVSPQSYLEIANDGLSEISSFTYFIPEIPKPETATDSIPKTDSTTPPPVVDQFIASDCGGIDITDSVAFNGNIKDSTLTIAGFNLLVHNAVKANDNTFTGTGYVEWTPFLVPLRLAVNLQKIKVNKQMQVIDGFVTTIVDDNFQKLKNVGPDFDNLISNITSVDLNNLSGRLNNAAHNLKEIYQDLRELKFPLGLDKSDIIDDVQTTLAITNIVFSPKGTNMHMLFAMEAADADVGTENIISLGGSNFCIQPEGFGKTNGILYLPKDQEFTIVDNVFTFKASPFNANTNVVDTTDKSYVLWNVDSGFVKMVVSADVNVSKDFLVPLDSANNRIEGGRVNFNTKFAFSKWNDWIATLTADASFEITELNDFKINVNQGIYYDHSAFSNSPGFTLPNRYTDGDTTSGFMGLYIHKLDLTIPNNFVKEEAQGHTKAAFNHLIIDKNGVSTSIHATDLLNLETGELGGWGFSIDTFNVSIVKNNPTEFMDMTGYLTVPISKQPFKYLCNLENSPLNDALHYQFIVRPDKDIEMTAWKAYLTISEESNFSIISAQGKTSIQAEMHGAMGIDIALPEFPKVKFPEMAFAHMKIANSANYYDTVMNMVDKWGDSLFFALESLKFGSTELMDSTAKEASHTDAVVEKPTIAGFNFTVDKATPTFKPKSKTQLELGLSLDISLDVGGESYGVAAKAKNFRLSGNIFSHKAPEFGEVAVDTISIDGSFGPVEVKGYLAFITDDPVWGDGIAGACKVGFPPGISVDANVVFGEIENATDTFKYYGFGASLYVKEGIAPIGPLVINGFGGGFYKNLEMKLPSSEELFKSNKTSSASNLTMSPKKGAVTLQAQVSFSLVSSTVLKSSVLLSASINDKGGLSNMSLDGVGDLISDGEKDSKGIATAEVKLLYDYENDIFDGYFSTKAALFDGTIKVDIPIWVHVSSKDGSIDGESEEQKEQRRKNQDNFKFFLYVGHPGTSHNGDGPAYGDAYRRIQVTLMELGEKEKNYVYLGATAYFCLGNVLPPMPGLPDKVAEFSNANGKNTNILSILTQSMGTNNPGFMFGAEVNGNLDLKLAMFYAKIEAILGFDVAMMRFSDPGSCAQPDGSFGMNNWYAMGQMYAYFNMDVGFKVNVWFYKGNVSLATMSMGAVLQAGLPNPSWMTGKVRIEGSVLAGLIKVNANCDLEVGTVCIPEIDPLKDIQLITEVGPEGDDISVFAHPYIVFSMPMQETAYEFQVPSNNPDRNEPIVRRFKFKVEEWTVKLKGENGDKILANTTESYNADKHVMTIGTGQALEENSKYEIYVKCSAHEFNFKTGEWGHPEGYKDGLTQDTTVYFFSGTAPDTISEKHIVFSYPLNEQNYLLKEEFGGRGVIKIDKWVDNYFSSASGSMDDLNVIFVEKGPRTLVGNSGEMDTAFTRAIKEKFTISQANREIAFNIPSQLKNDTKYDVFFSVKTKGGVVGVTRSKDIDLLKKDEDLAASSSSGSSSGTINDRFNEIGTTNQTKSGKGLAGGSSSGSTSGGVSSGKTQGSGDRVGVPRGGVSGSDGKLTDGGLNSSFSSNNENVTRIPPTKKSGGTAEAISNTDTFTLLGRDLGTYVAGSSERIIYKMNFTTSKYNDLNTKLNAYGTFTASESGVKESLSYVVGTKNYEPDYEAIHYSDMYIQSNNAGEPFDAFEISGLLKSVGEDNSVFEIYTPPILHTSIVFNPTMENDKAMKPFYEKLTNLVNSATTEKGTYGDVTIDLGSSIVVDLGNYSLRRAHSRINDIPTITTSLQNPATHTIENVHADGPLFIINKRDMYYAWDYVLLQNAVDAYSRLPKKSKGTVKGGSFNQGLKFLSSTSYGSVKASEWNDIDYENLLTIQKEKYREMAYPQTGRKITFEFGYSPSFYESYNQDYDPSQPPVSSQVPMTYQTVSTVDKTIQ